jgi:uncharacterized repeat protein (TIGR01451 family)
MGGDDQDPEEITIAQIYDLALIKQETSAGPYLPGEDVTYTITVCNQGTLDANNVEVTDYVPADMTLSATDANGWSGAAAGPVNAIIPFVGVGRCVDIEIDLTIDPSFAGGTIVNFAEISADDGDDVDSTPNTTNGDDAGGVVNSPTDNIFNGDGVFDEDDHDPEDIVVEIFDLALAKTLSTNTPGPFSAGDVVTYDIEITNQGSTNAFAISVADNVPAGLILVDQSWSLVGGDAVLNNPITFLAPGQSSTVSITFLIDPNFMGTQIINDAEITAADNDTNPFNTPPTDVDSTPGDNATPDDLANNDDIMDTMGGDDQDPELIAIGQIYDLALAKKEASSGPYSPGDDVEYTITVCNQGTLNASGIEVSDYIPAGMTLSAADANGWIGSPVGPVTNTIASLAAQACTDLTIILTIDADFQGTSISNNAEITADDGDDIDSTPGDNSQPDDFADDDDMTETDGGDDEDPEVVMVEQEYDLALIKEENSQGPYIPGDDVTYTITVCNQGSLDASAVEVTDYIPSDMTLSVNDLNGWMASGASEVTNVIPLVAVETCETVDIVLTIDPAFAGGDIINFAEISSDDGDDIDSTPNSINGDDAGGSPQTPSDDEFDGDGTGVIGDAVAATDEDDHDPELITVEIFDLALAKTVSSNTPGPFEPGDVVTYNLEVTNQGSIDAFNIDLIDNVPTGLILIDNDWSLVGGVADLDSPISFLAAGASTIVPVTFLIDSNFGGASIINDAEISSADNNTNPNDTPPTDTDSTPGDNATPDDLPGDNDIADMMGGDDQDPEQIEVVQDVDVFDLALIKTVSASTPGPYQTGGLVTFDITVENQGNVDAFNIQVTDYIPAGLILADATWIQVGPNAELLTPIPFLTAGASTVVSITFQIDPAAGSGFILNDSEITSADDDTDANNAAPVDIDSTPGDDITPDDEANNDDLSDANGGDDQDPEGIQVCKPSFAGLIFPGSADNCLVPGGSTIRNAVAGGQVVSPGDEIVYILVDVNGDIVDVSAMPEFVISMTGDFTIHPVVYDPTLCDLPSLTSVDEILNGCECFDIDLVGVEANVEECCDANAGGLTNVLVDGCADDRTANGNTATFSVQSVATNVPAGSQVLFILTSGGIVQETSTSPSFDIGMSGLYTIHTLVYDAAFDLSFIELGVTPINEVNVELVTQGICGDVNLRGIDGTVEACDGDCPFDLFLPATTPIRYEVENTITSDAVVTGGGVIEFSAGTEILLLPGFEVTVGTEFHAFIEGCSN